MAFSDTALRNLKPADSNYERSDGGGMFIEVTPSGRKTWGIRYRLAGKQEKAILGEYPAYGLQAARQWREETRALVAKGQSPNKAKKALFAGEGNGLPEDVRQYAIKWWKAGELAGEVIKAESMKSSTVEVFARQWRDEVVVKNVKDHYTVERILNKDIIPAIGSRQLDSISIADVMAITDRIKARGADQMALQTRNVLKRLFAYAIARQKITFNPAAAIEAQFIATASSRDVALSPDEVGKVIRAVYQSSMKRAHKLALHLLILCMVRKSELTEARWEEIDFDKAEWTIPGERMKKDRPHVVPLSAQALEMFRELKSLSCGSVWIFPSRGTLDQPISKNTLNNAIRSLEINTQAFVIHDFRRTASTILHEAGFNSDWVEKCLAHEQKGVRGVYNKAEYLAQRRDMLQWWADLVDEQTEEGRRVIIGRFAKAPAESPVIEPKEQPKPVEPGIRQQRLAFD
jgi:integrase